MQHIALEKPTQFKQKDISLFFSNAKALLKNQQVTILWVNNGKPIAERLLIIISKKIGNAVIRNLLRRRIKAIYTLNKELFETIQLCFIFKRNIATFKELQSLFEQIKETINIKIKMQKPQI
jgi:ribonuclease P protein component